MYNIKKSIFSQKINLAIQVASKSHHGQFRKTTTKIPYIAHPIGVMLIGAEYTNDENTLIACLLHDILEDVNPTIYSESDLISDFGNEVLQIVKSVSENKTAGQPKKPWLERKEYYLNLIRNTSDPRPLIVATADKIHNLHDTLEAYHCQSIGEKIWQNFNASKHDQLWFYQSFLAIIINKPIPSEMKKHLDRLIRDLKTII